jgi:hypothetical protein
MGDGTVDEGEVEEVGELYPDKLQWEEGEV